MKATIEEVLWLHEKKGYEMVINDGMLKGVIKRKMK